MKTQIYVLVALAACSGLLLPVFSAGLPESSATIYFSGVVQQTSTGTYSYIISVSGSNYQMTDGTTGQIVFQSTNSSQVFSNVVGACPAGGTIDVLPGVYTVTASWTILNINDITVNFEGESELVAASDLNNPVLYLNNANNCLISGVTINGNSANQATDSGVGGTTLEDGILLNPVSSNNHVDGANITNCGRFGFSVMDGASKSNKITHSIVTFCGWTSIGFGIGTINNYAENNQVAYGGDVGITTYGTGSVITNNYVHDMNGTLGYNNANWGIGVEGGSSDLITQNIIQKCAIGIQDSGFNNCTISDNTISNSVEAGIHLSVGCEQNSVINNHVTTVSSGGIGICLEGATFNLISGNYVSLATFCGIYLDSTSNHNTISLNYVFDNGVTGSGNCGLWIYGSSNIISQNQAYDDRATPIQEYGIRMETGASQNVLTGNNVYNNRAYQIYDPNVPENTMINNTGYNPVGYIASPISGSTAYLVDSGSNATWISAKTYTNSGSPKELFISAGIVSVVAQNGVTLFTATGCTVTLQPGDTFSVTFSTTPTINVVGQ